METVKCMRGVNKSIIDYFAQLKANKFETEKMNHFLAYKSSSMAWERINKYLNDPIII